MRNGHPGGPDKINQSIKLYITSIKTMSSTGDMLNFLTAPWVEDKGLDQKFRHIQTHTHTHIYHSMRQTHLFSIDFNNPYMEELGVFVGSKKYTHFLPHFHVHLQLKLSARIKKNYINL